MTSETETVEKQKEKPCSACGIAHAKDDKFCPNCGVAVGAVPAPQQTSILSTYRQHLSDWLTNLSKEPSKAILLLLILIVALALIAAAFFALTNNVVAIGLFGVIIGSVFTILGLIVDSIWLEPKRREQENKEKEEKLRKALYTEILSVVYEIFATIWRCKNGCEKANLKFLQSTHKRKDWAIDPTDFRLHENIKTDPVAFYQLPDANDIDGMHIRLKASYNLFLEEFDCVCFNSVEAATPSYNHLKRQIPKYA
jgi:hypothetical protein